MSIQDAVKKVIDDNGIEVVNNDNFINMLSDYGAFDTIPLLKYILNSVIKDGYLKQMLAIGVWNEQSENLCNRFVAKTGFQPDYVSLVFQSIAFGLGWIREIQMSEDAVSGEIKQQTILPNKEEPVVLVTDKEKADFLLSKTEFVNDMKAETGLELTNLSFDICDNCSFYINFEINGKIKKNVKDVGIDLMVYNDKNKVKTIESLWGYEQWWLEHDGELFPGHSEESCYISMPMPIEKVSKIRIVQERLYD